MIQILRMYVNKGLHYPSSYEVVQNALSNTVKLRFLSDDGELLECRPEDASSFTNRYLCDIPLYVGDILQFTMGSSRVHGVIRPNEKGDDLILQTCCLTDTINLDHCLSHCNARHCGNVFETPNATRMLLDVVCKTAPLPQTDSNYQSATAGQNDNFSLPSVVPQDEVVIYTDGCCLSNPGGDGGWAYVRIENGSPVSCSGYISDCTNNIAELTAVIEALKSVSGKNRMVHIHSDSQYVIKAFTDGWLNKWKQNGWTTSSGDPVKNIGLWSELDVLAHKHCCSWTWVKGHNNNRFNEMCDALAGRAASSAYSTKH